MASASRQSTKRWHSYCAVTKPALCAAEPTVLEDAELQQLKWGAADEEGVVEFLVNEKSFSEERVRKQVQKMNASRGKANQGAPRPMLAGSAAGAAAREGQLLSRGL